MGGGELHHMRVMCLFLTSQLGLGGCQMSILFFLVKSNVNTSVHDLDLDEKTSFLDFVFLKVSITKIRDN